jgi:hypothetical protein
LLEHAKTINDRITVYKILILHYARQGNIQKPLTKEKPPGDLGMEWPVEDLANRVEAELSEVQYLFSMKNPEALLRMPLLTDSHQNMIMQVLHALIFPAFFSI